MIATAPTQSELDSVFHTIDSLQASNEELAALTELTKYIQAGAHTSEWEPINLADENRFPWESELTNADTSFLSALSHCEMGDDMDRDEDSFQGQEMTHRLLVDPSSLGSFPTTTSMSNDNRFIAWGEVIYIGDSYATALSDYGKVFLSKSLFDTDLWKKIQVGWMGLCVMKYLGNQDCRKEALPWRAISVSRFS